ncbi:MAG: dephospho-CoA kinase [candidate division WOR-3 bacterium]|nr:dephospho-CoA kinase [candidate division WOR-3 bacterium]
MTLRSSSKSISIGIGGNIGAGKTTVANALVKHFQNAGYRVCLIEADKIAWQLYKYSSNNQVYHKIVKTFGTKILNKYKEIDRKALAKIVFSDKEKLQKLNKIVHPQLIKTINTALQKKDNIIKILDAALLFFWGRKIKVNYRILVTASKAQKISRMLKRGYNLNDILVRLKQQMKEKDMQAMADFIIDNHGSKAELQDKIRLLYKDIIKEINTQNKSN